MMKQRRKGEKPAASKANDEATVFEPSKAWASLIAQKPCRST